MIDNPAAFQEFAERYSSEQACVETLFSARWPDGFRCPHCSHPHYYLTRTRRLPLFECASCRRQTSITVGTIMEGSYTPLRQWFQAVYLLSQPSGISSVELSKILGVTYKTAWLISHKIRHAMSLATEAQVLTGVVRIEQYDYGPLQYMDAHQPLLLAATLNDNQQPDQIRIVQPSPDHVEDDSRRITKFGIEACQAACTDGQDVAFLHGARKWLPSLRAHKIQNRNWLNYTFCGIRAKHLQAYLNEYCYRVNRQSIYSISGSLFPHALIHCATSHVLTYPELIRDKPVLQPPWKKYATKKQWRKRWYARLCA